MLIYVACLQPYPYDKIIKKKELSSVSFSTLYSPKLNNPQYWSMSGCRYMMTRYTIPHRDVASRTGHACGGEEIGDLIAWWKECDIKSRLNLDLWIWIESEKSASPLRGKMWELVLCRWVTKARLCCGNAVRFLCAYILRLQFEITDISSYRLSMEIVSFLRASVSPVLEKTGGLTKSNMKGRKADALKGSGVGTQWWAPFDGAY